MSELLWMLLSLFLVYIPMITCQNLSKRHYRSLLDILVQGVHSTTTECPSNLLAEGVSLNNSDLLPLTSEFQDISHIILNPRTTNASYGSDMTRLASFSRLVTNWCVTNALQQDFSQLRDSEPKKTFLQLMFRAFIQTENLYLDGPPSKNVVVPYLKSNIRSVSLCANNSLILHESPGTGLDEEGMQRTYLSKENFCNQLLLKKEDNISFIQIGTSFRMLGYWAPLYCQPKTPAHQILLHLIVPIQGVKNLNLIFEFDIKNLTLDLCAANLDFCRHSTMQCVYRQYKMWPFDVGNYLCRCKTGFWIGNPENGYKADEVEQPPSTKRSKNGSYSGGSRVETMSCKRCPHDCPNCTSGRSCGVEYNMQMLRGIPLAVQTFSITTCFFLGIVTFRIRRTRVFKAANWIFLELYLLGAILLYFTTIVMYFRASTSTCILLPWLREMGFAMMYGVLIVKVYRVLLSFQSRKAHRVHVRDKDLFKYLGCFIAIVVGYMVAWTAVNLDYTRFNRYVGVPSLLSPGLSSSGVPQSSLLSARVLDSGAGSMLVKGHIAVQQTPKPQTVSKPPSRSSECSTCNPMNATSEKVPTAVGVESDDAKSNPPVQYQYFLVCRALSWDIVVEIGETLILFLGVHYCRLIWSAPSEYQENRCITVALLTELVISGTLYLTRHFIWYSVHPDVFYIIYFIRCHLTVSLNVALIFGLKFWYMHKPPVPPPMAAGRGMVGAAPGASAAPHLVPSNKLRLASNGELDLADVNLADMDPEVIRRELKRLYTAIEIYKTKAMRRDNPHISKRRGGRKQRRFSLQPFHKKHHAGHLGGGSSLIRDGGGGVSESMIERGDHSMPLKPGKGVVMRGGGCGSHSNYPSLALDEEGSRISEGEGSLNESIMDEPDQQSTTASSPQSQQNFNSTSLRGTNSNAGYSRGQKRH